MNERGKEGNLERVIRNLSFQHRRHLMGESKLPWEVFLPYPLFFLSLYFSYQTLTLKQTMESLTLSTAVEGREGVRCLLCLRFLKTVLRNMGASPARLLVS